MATLTAKTVAPGLDFAVQNDAGADTGTQGYQNQAFQLLTIVVVFPQSSAVRIIAQVHGYIPATVEDLRHRHEPDGNIYGFDHHAPAIVYRTGKAHSHRGYLAALYMVLLQQSQRHIHQCLPHLLHGDKLQRHFLCSHQPVALVHQSGLQIGSANINTYIVHSIPTLFQHSHF